MDKKVRHKVRIYLKSGQEIDLSVYSFGITRDTETDLIQKWECEYPEGVARIISLPPTNIAAVVQLN